MTAYNRDTQVNTIIHFFVVPFIISIVASIGICAIHCSCSCKKERPKYRRPRVENIRHVLNRLLMTSNLATLKFEANFPTIVFPRFFRLQRKFFAIFFRVYFQWFLNLFSVPKSFDDIQGFCYWKISNRYWTANFTEIRADFRVIDLQS